MAIYDFEFAKTLIFAAQSVEAQDVDSSNARRAILYLSLLSIEIILKALLEKAGVEITTIKARSHNLDQLLTDICYCEYEKDIGTGSLYWASAADLRGIAVYQGEAMSTIGQLFSNKTPKSRYPNEIRYGESFTHYWPPTMLKAAVALSEWAIQYSASIRVRRGLLNA